MSENLGIAMFVAELEKLGYKPRVQDKRVVFEYHVPCGRFEGQNIKLGFEVPPDFNQNPPTGPHVSPLLLPVNNGVGNHPERVHGSNFNEQFGGDWEYWSRPYIQWQKTNRSVRVYLNYVKHLFETQ